MIGDPRQSTVTSQDTVDRLLLDAKTTVPEWQAGAVSRGLTIAAARAGGRRVIGVTAPAGYGKTTLLAEWAHLEDRPVAWGSLDRFDDDPVVLLGLIAHAFARAVPGHEGLEDDMRSHRQSVLGRAAPRLAAVLRASSTPFVLVVDDLHELRSPACHDVLGVVVAGMPAGAQFVAASRVRQPHLARFRANDQVVELGTADLAMDVRGARQLFAAEGVELGGQLAAAVVERTEGWPVGLRLAALVAESTEHAAAITGDDRDVADYLYRESLAPLDEGLRRFLCRTAVLDHLSATVCDAVVGEPGSQAKLQQLEIESVFVVPLDRRREVFRYHALFREFLLGELRRDAPELIPELHRRAAEWHERHGSPGTAIDHYIAAGERRRTTGLVVRTVLENFQQGRLSTIEGWFRAIGDPAVKASPLLSVLAGWIAALSGRSGDALRWASVVDDGERTADPASEPQGLVAGRAMLRAAMGPDGAEQIMRDALLAVAAEPEWSPWRDRAVCLLGEAQLLAGDVGRAEHTFAEASTAAAALGNPVVVALAESELAVIAMDRGKWDQAAEAVSTALTAIERHHIQDYAVAVPAFAAAARLAVHRGDDDTARRMHRRAMRGRPLCTVALPYIAVRVRLELAKLSWAAGDHATARHLLREMEELMRLRPHLGALAAQVQAFRQATAETNETVVMPTPLTPAELRLLPYLQTHLSLREIGDRLFVSRNTVSSEVGSIYRKLGVSTRSDAVGRAAAMGLLGG